MSKSLEEIWEKMQQELQSKKDAETAKENELFQIAEKKRCSRFNKCYPSR